MNLRYLTLLVFALAAATVADAQHMVNGFIQELNHGSVCLSYSREKYDDFYFGDLRGNDRPVRPLENNYGGKVVTQTVSLFMNYGIAKNLEMAVNIPYIHSQGYGERGEGKPDQEEGDFQDASLFIKWRPVSIDLNSGSLNFVAALGGSQPLADYEVKQLISIGNQGSTLTTFAVAHYQHNSGAFIDLQAGYSVRGNDVPNATLLGSALGYAQSRYYFDFFSQVQISDPSAPDIMDIMQNLGENEKPPFNETRVNFAQLGVNTYYNLVPSLGGGSNSFGISAKLAKTVWGRNVGIPFRVSGSLIFKF